MTIYIFSDGYVDQKGQESDKKLGSNAFIKLLVSLSEIPTRDHLAGLETHLKQFMGDQNQSDDICIVGVRI